MREKIHSYLGFAKRSRNLLTGYNTCMYGLDQRKIKLLILAKDLSDNTLKKFTKKAKDLNVAMRICGSTEELSEMTGEAITGVYGVTDKGLAGVILKEIDEKQGELV